MKYAIIDRGRVRQIVDKKFPMAETQNLFFKEFDESKISVKEGYYFINDKLKETDLSDEEFLKQQKSIEKEAKKREIAEAKKQALYAPIDYLGTAFTSSEKASQNMLGALLLNGDENTWFDIYGEAITLTKNQLTELAIKIKTQRATVYANEAEKIKQIEAASTIKELKNISW